MVAAGKIAEVLGLKRIHTLPELAAAVAHGLPKSALKTCVGRIFPRPADQKPVIYRVVPEGTYKRRRHALKFDESERTERLARVIATAEYVWDDKEDARAFLTSPHPGLEGRRPIDVAVTELGARRVEDLLWKVFYGVPV
ncbi:MAG: DUF2384 domain-containing protein [Nitrospirae bacterium]|nr:DUF2384 domain-containing protein [Nitrospirota bacterium]